MKYELGVPKDLESITKDDVIKNKVWLWTWEAGLEGEYDEDWQVPLKGINEINKDFVEPIITLEISGTELIASASFDNDENKISGIVFWENNSWKSMSELNRKEPIEFISMVTINGDENSKFIMIDKNFDEALMEK